MTAEEVPTFTIVQADGLFPDDAVEHELFAPKPGQNYKIDYRQVNLWPSQSEEPQPWSSLSKDLRDKVDGITVLKLYFTEQDVELFPNLKV